jgi:hypothetical protein
LGRGTFSKESVQGIRDGGKVKDKSHIDITESQKGPELSMSTWYRSRLERSSVFIGNAETPWDGSHVLSSRPFRRRNDTVLA